MSHDAISRLDPRLKVVFETIAQPLLVLDADLRVENANEAFLRQFQVSREETAGTLVYDLGNGQWNIPDLRRLLEEALTRNNRVKDYRVEHEFEQIGKRVMLLNAHAMGEEGGPSQILLAISDVTERETLIWELEAGKEFAEKLIDSIREGLLVLESDLRVQSANASFYQKFELRPEETEGRMIYELGNGEWDIPKLRELLEEILPEKTSFDDFEVEQDFDPLGRRIMVLNARRLDHHDLILLAIRDVTEEREHQRRQQTFVAELQHRVKNILNNVRALASQTRRRSATLDGFFESFDARLGALGRAQDLLMQSPSEAVSLREVIRVELEALGAEQGRHYTIEGPTIRMPPRDAQTLAMLAHELATNASKYGALATESGRIDIAWRVEDREDGPFVLFNWRERGVEIKDDERLKGFGSEVIEESLPYMLGGGTSLLFHADGVECRADFPRPDV